MELINEINELRQLKDKLKGKGKQTAPNKTFRNKNDSRMNESSSHIENNEEWAKEQILQRKADI